MTFEALGRRERGGTCHFALGRAWRVGGVSAEMPNLQLRVAVKLFGALIKTVAEGLGGYEIRWPRLAGFLIPNCVVIIHIRKADGRQWTTSAAGTRQPGQRQLHSVPSSCSSRPRLRHLAESRTKSSQQGTICCCLIHLLDRLVFPQIIGLSKSSRDWSPYWLPFAEVNNYES